MSEIKGCMNCGNILCKNNKKRESAGCGRYISPEDKIKELEAEVKEWKDKADLWCKTANLKDHNIMINKELEKENAELKEKVNILDNCDRLGDVITEAYKEQLTKATEIIKKLYAVYYDPCVTESDLKYRDELFAEIKQFLSEVEK